MESSGRVVLISDPRCLDHDTGGGEHPEIAQRLMAIEQRLSKGGLASSLDFPSLHRAEWEWLLAAHDEDYLFRFEEAALSGKAFLSHPDNQISYGSYEAALFAAGAGPLAVDLLEAAPSCIPFCSIRPPGHHAEASRAMGFCFLNNAVVAVRYWQRNRARRRVLVFDFDAHHGNGIQRAFEADPDVFYVSIHEHPTFSFPGTGYAGETGTGAGAGATLNLPLPPGSGDRKVLNLLHDLVEPAVARFSPEALVVSAGFDGHEKDDMSGLSYSSSLFGEIGETVGRWAQTWCAGKVLSILEGGYHLEALAESVESYLAGIAAARDKELKKCT